MQAYLQQVGGFLRVPVSSTNKTDHHDITEVLLKVVFNTITITHLISTLNTFNDAWYMWFSDDEMFDDLSEGLVRKKDWMFEKYRGLLLEESMVCV